jgi:hypothetical protein
VGNLLSDAGSSSPPMHFHAVQLLYDDYGKDFEAMLINIEKFIYWLKKRNSQKKETTSYHL